MTKPKVFLLVGLPHAGVPALTAGLDAHREPLEAAGFRLPARSADEMFRASVEIRREHRAWGLRRKDIEGTWAKVARRATRKLGKGDTVVLGHELLAGAGRDQIALLADGLAGTALHVVVVATAPDPLAGLVPDELDLADVASRWAVVVRAPDRVHLLITDPADAWRELGDLVGFDASALPLPGPAPDAGPLDFATLRLLADATYAVLDPDDQVEMAEQWAKLVADQGYDVRGDLRSLTPEPGSGPTDPLRARDQVRVEVLRTALGETVAEVGRLRARLG